MTVLKATGIFKSFGALPILKGVDLEIRQGEVVSILGRSGAGKSTLLHILGTLDRADAGDIQIAGVSTKPMSAKQLAVFRNKHIGFVFQFHHLLPEFTALENVCIPAYIAGVSDSEAKTRAEKLLRDLGLGDRLDHKPTQLSGGEQQRVAVARALVNQPDLIFADEPTGNLDSANAQDLHRLIRKLCDEYRQTFVIVTHNQELAALSDRRLEMKDGVLTTS